MPVVLLPSMRYYRILEPYVLMVSSDTWSLDLTFFPTVTVSTSLSHNLNNSWTPWGNWTPLPTHFLYHVFWIASLCTLCISLTHLCTSKGTLTSSDKTKDFYSVPHILATKSSEDLKFLFFFYHSCFHKSFSVEGTNWR